MTNHREQLERAEESLIEMKEAYKIFIKDMTIENRKKFNLAMKELKYNLSNLRNCINNIYFK